MSLENKLFRFVDEFIGSVMFKNATIDGWSLATLMYGRPDSLLMQIRNGMKIVNGSVLENMDDATFDALMRLGIDICNEHEKEEEE
jgi:hypothetical protein